MLQVGDKILRVEVSGSLSQLVSWKSCQKLDQKFKWQFESSNEHAYFLQTSNILSPIVEES
jgi:hypothetical protein